MMRRTILTILALVAMTAGAQIPKDIQDIMNKAGAWMENKKGVDINMDVKAAMITMHTRMVEKGDKQFTTIDMKFLGKQVHSEQGYDGQQEWSYKSNMDTLYVWPSTKKPEKDESMGMMDVSEYRQAKMKVKNDNYVITFSDPTDKELPKKMTVTIRQKDYRPMEFLAGSGMMKMRLTIISIKHGVSDDIFVLNPNRYPTAKIAQHKPPKRQSKKD